MTDSIKDIICHKHKHPAESRLQKGRRQNDFLFYTHKKGGGAPKTLSRRFTEWVPKLNKQI